MHLRREYAISLRNILFKEIVSHLVMYLFDQSKIQVDCLTPKKFLKDIKVIPSKQCITQHKPFVFDFKVVKAKDSRKDLTPGEMYGNYMKTV